MSDNVIRPAQWMANAEASLAAAQGATLEASAVVGGGNGPHNPGMEARLTAVETSVLEIKGILQRLEPAIIRVDSGVRKLEADVTLLKTDVTELKINVAELKGRVSQLPTALQLIGFVLAVLVAGGLIHHFFP